jgi:hypothetical protein
MGAFVSPLYRTTLKFDDFIGGDATNVRGRTEPRHRPGSDGGSVQQGKSQ